MNDIPAFPRPFSEDTYLEGVDYVAQDGMTLRDYFAAKSGWLGILLITVLSKLLEIVVSIPEDNTDLHITISSLYALYKVSQRHVNALG